MFTFMLLRLMGILYFSLVSYAVCLLCFYAFFGYPSNSRFCLLVEVFVLFLCFVGSPSEYVFFFH